MMPIPLAADVVKHLIERARLVLGRRGHSDVPLGHQSASFRRRLL
jgi:hypothetical protein